MRKENISRIIQSTLLSAAMLFGMCGMSAVSAETNAKASFEGNTGSSSESKWTVSKSKTASPTELDSDNNTTEVTLSLPSAEKTLTTDIVFVLDFSSCAEETLNELTSMLTDLQTSYSVSHAQMNIGIIGFRGNAISIHDLAPYAGDTTYNTITGELATYVAYETNDESALHGSNMPSGLLAAKNMLAGDTDADSKKYMILVSDGATYLYPHTDPSECYSRTSGISNNDGILYEWVPKYGAYSDAAGNDVFNFPSSFTNGGDSKDWNDFMNAIGGVRENFTQYDQLFEHSKKHPDANLTLPNPAISDISSFITNNEESFWQSYNYFSGMENDGISCFAVVPPSTTDNFVLFKSFMNYLASIGKGGGTDFSEVKNSILYLLASGSVNDKIGDNFDFVHDDNCPFTQTKAGTQLSNVKTGDNEWSFGDADTNGVYPYVVTCSADFREFDWKINVPVENASPLQLKYKLKIKDSVTESGTYDTNNSATLDYTDSNGVAGDEETFDVPQVNYTVIKPTLWCVTFLDCKGNTVSVQWIKNGENATAPTGFGTYSGYTNITGHRDLKPTSCGTNTGWVVPNTADRS